MTDTQFIPNLYMFNIPPQFHFVYMNEDIMLTCITNDTISAYSVATMSVVHVHC